MVDKAALGQISEYFGSPANHSTDFSTLIIIHDAMRPVMASLMVDSVPFHPLLCIFFS
jgi:hypothetical protein